MKRLPELFIHDIAENILDMERFSRDLAKEQLKTNKLRQNAIVRSLEVIGEAAAHVPPSFREKYPEIKWKKIVGFRNIIIHSYFKVDIDIVWDVIRIDIPLLKTQIEKIKKDLEEKK